MAGEKKAARKMIRIKNKIKGWLTDPYSVIFLVLLVTLLFLIIVPLWEIIKESFQMSASDARKAGVSAGTFTLDYWKQLLHSKISRKLLYEPLLHSLTIAFSVSILSITIGGLTAWLMVRTDLPFKRFFSLAIIVPYMLPAWCKAMAWIAVFKNPRIGGTTGFLSYMGIQVPDWLAYGPVAIILVLSIHNYAYTYLLVSSALKSVNTELEEMAEIAGAGRWYILSKITFPLVLPSILGAFILTFSQAMGTFSVPAFLGLKTGYYTISTMLQSSLMQGNNGVAMAISIILIGIASPIDSWWDLTREEWNGKFMIVDPLTDVGYMAFLTTVVENADLMAEAYKEEFGEEIVLAEDEPNAGYAFLKRFAQNKPIFETSSNNIVKAVGASGQEDAPIGYAVSSKIRERDQQGYLLGIDPLNFAPANGIYGMNVIEIADHAPNPDGAKLLIRYLTGDADGTARGFDPYNTLGGWSIRSVVPKVEGNIAFEDYKVFPQDLEYTYEHLDEVQEYWISVQP